MHFQPHTHSNKNVFLHLQRQFLLNTRCQASFFTQRIWLEDDRVESSHDSVCPAISFNNNCSIIYSTSTWQSGLQYNIPGWHSLAICVIVLQYNLTIFKQHVNNTTYVTVLRFCLEMWNQKKKMLHDARSVIHFKNRWSAKPHSARFGKVWWPQNTSCKSASLWRPLNPKLVPGKKWMNNPRQ